MAVINGRFIKLYWNGIEVPGCTTSDIAIDKNMIDITSKDSAGFSTFNGTGDITWTVNAELNFDSVAANGATTLIAALLAGTQAAVRIGETTSGGIYYTGNAFVQSTSISGPNNDKTTLPVVFQGSGVLTPTTV